MCFDFTHNDEERAQTHKFDDNYASDMLYFPYKWIDEMDKQGSAGSTATSHGLCKGEKHAWVTLEHLCAQGTKI